MQATSTQWQLEHNAAERYEQVLIPAILGPAARALVREAALNRGETVVDVGCGTGATARAAAGPVGPSGRVVGVDVNAGMLVVAASLPAVEGAAVEWCEGSAYDLPLAGGVADVVICAQALQFLKAPDAGLAEMWRVLKPGGRVAVSLWGDLGGNPYFDALVAAVARHVGPETAAGLGAAFRLSGAGELSALLERAAFECTECTVRRLDLPLPDLRGFVPRHIGATPMAAGYAAASESVRQAVVEEVVERLAPYRTGDGVRVPFRMRVGLARKPDASSPQAPVS